ncbi:MipA/OmpV family protein [Allostella humosa]|nr:MipA/OmpV family protein [Stella humosa]
MAMRTVIHLGASLVLLASAGTAVAADRWSATVGAGALVAPKYEGSGEMEILPLPILDLRWTPGYAGFHSVFLTTEQGLGIQFLDYRGFSLSASVNYDRGRDQDDDSNLRGLGNIDPGADLRLTAAYRIGGLRASLSAEQNFGGTDGVEVEAGLGYTQRFGDRFFLTGSVGATWADSDHMGGYFGVTRRQSLASGLPQYDADAGFKSVRVALTGRYAVTERWGVRGTVGLKRLLGDAADSPIVEEKLQPFALLGVTYTF